jgi:hypothetical protein
MRHFIATGIILPMGPQATSDAIIDSLMPLAILSKHGVVGRILK